MKRLLLALLVLGCTLSAQAAVDDLPCVVCHPSRDRTAYQLLSGVAGVRTGQESAQAFVCRSCHNGVVRDDRQKLDQGGQHPVGVRARVATPATLPLYGNRELECGTCHSPHGEGPAAQRWLRLEFAGGTLCTTCHGEHRDRHLGRTLAPAQTAAILDRGGRVGEKGLIECGTCHVPHGAAGPSLLLAPYGPDQNQLCRTCHPAQGVKGVAAAEGGQACAGCHQPHTETAWQLRGDDGGPCLACHTERAAAGEHPRVAAACSECHSMHSPVRPGGSPTGLLRLPTEGGVLCAACHQESFGAHGDAVRVTPDVAAGLRAKGLPVTAETAACTTCHRMHAPRDTPLLRMPQTIICLYCHPDENPFGPTGVRAGVHPMAVRLDAEQGAQLETGGGRVGPGGELACNSCHRTHGEQSGAKVSCVTCHPGQEVERGHAGNGDCSTCHAMHGEDPHGHSCEECHREHGNGPHKERQVLTAAALPAVDSQGKLAMTGILGCPSCHDPHENSAPLLRRGTPAAVCVACHQDKAALAGSSHDTDTPGESLCKPCHPSHGEASAPTGDDPAAARCTGCHLEDRLITQGHSRQGTPPWRQLTAELPLFDQAGERNPYGFISCPTCHDVHTSAERRSMRADEHDPPHLCLGCHQEKVSLLGSSHDPRQSGSETTCTACHPLHPEQDGPGAWTFGEDAQGTWNDRKCTPCHSAPENNPWGYTDTTSHPVNVLLPQRMGSGELPLFDALGGTMGRVVACTTCHDLHGTPAGPETTIPYFLRLDPSSGGLCITCHKDAGSVIGTAHDVGGDPDPLGPCSPCHVAHGATSARALWWMEPAPGEYEPNRLCRSCHRAGGSAEGEYLLMQYHMKDAEEVRSPRGTIYLQRPMLILDELALRSGNEPIIPLFQRDGTAGPSGNLQCVSCHEPHQWSPMGAFVKPGFGTLGPNVPTMFLRLGDPKKAKLSVCAVCHPDDAERRYMEYHRVWSDVGATFQ